MSRTGRKHKVRRGRDIRNITNRQVAPRHWSTEYERTRTKYYALPDDPLRSGYMQEIEDRRRFHPAIYRAARTLDGSRPRLAPRGKTSRLYTPNEKVVFGVGFQEPDRVLVCVRRQQRKEVLHARGVAGSKGIFKRTLSEFSDISCKRR